MTGRRQMLVAAGVAVAAAITGFTVHLWRVGPADTASARLLTVALPDLEGRSQALEQWRGKVMVINFWATWCTPCREEVPALVKLQAAYGGRGVQFVGIAIDQRDKVEAFAREFRMNYPVLLGGIDTIEISREAGNRIGALPFTLVLNREGRIVDRKLGKISEERLEDWIKGLL